VGAAARPAAAQELERLAQSTLTAQVDVQVTFNGGVKVAPPLVIDGVSGSWWLTAKGSAVLPAAYRGRAAWLAGYPQSRVVLRGDAVNLIAFNP
jgi:hypothetical protein